VTSGWTVAPVIILQSASLSLSSPAHPITKPNPANPVEGDFNADGYDYDAPNTPSFGKHIKASRSDFVKGVSSNRLRTNQRWYVALANVRAGRQLGRNTYDGPGFAVVNMTVERPSRSRNW